MPLSWVPLSWMPLYWMPLCWMSLCWMPLWWIPLCWIPLWWMPLWWMLRHQVWFVKRNKWMEMRGWLSWIREPLLKGKPKYHWPPCTNKYRWAAFDIANIIYKTRNPNWRGKLSTIDLLVLTSTDEPILILQTLFTKRATLMRRLIVLLSLRLQLVFPGWINWVWHESFQVENQSNLIQ